MMKEVLWGETEENGGEKMDRSRSPLMLDERREASERQVEVRLRRNSDEEMESEEEEEEEEELDRDGCDVLASVINTAVKSDGFFRHQQVKVLLKSAFKKAECLQPQACNILCTLYIVLIFEFRWEKVSWLLRRRRRL